MASLRLLAGSLLAAWLLQASPPPTLVVIDTDSPALAPDEATRLRSALLDGLDPAITRYARLSRDGLVVVSPAEAPRLIGTTYLAPPPPEVTFTAAVEILRGNQAVRDDLLARRCGGSSGCGSRMAALVEATVRDTERRTSRKVRSLAGAARANPGVFCRGNIVDDILFSSNLVARWAWLVAGTQIEEVEQELLFLPGRWLNPVLAELGHAHQAAQQSGLDATEAKRRKLLAELLVGLEV